MLNVYINIYLSSCYVDRANETATLNYKCGLPEVFEHLIFNTSWT